VNNFCWFGILLGSDIIKGKKMRIDK